MVADLTIVVPVYNGARHLTATLDSLAAQTISPYVIVVDDGSRDDSARLAEDHPVVDEVLTQPNRGVAASRNRGLARARSKWVAFLDQDDLWHSTRVQSMLDLAVSSGRAACGSTEQSFAFSSDRATLAAVGDARDQWVTSWIEEGEEGALVTQDLPEPVGEIEVPVERLMGGAASVTTSFVYEREAAIVAGGCAPFIKAADDHVLNVNMAHLFGPLLRVDQPSVFYRIHPGATTNSSPLVASLLSLQLALRHGRALPSEASLGHNLRHLMWNVDSAVGLDPWERVALIVLNSPPDERLRWLGRWAKRALRGRLEAIRGSNVIEDR